MVIKTLINNNYVINFKLTKLTKLFIYKLQKDRNKI